MFTVLSVRKRAEFRDKSLKEMCVIVGVYEGGGGPGAERKKLFRQRRNICIHGGVDQP